MRYLIILKDKDEYRFLKQLVDPTFDVDNWANYEYPIAVRFDKDVGIYDVVDGLLNGTNIRRVDIREVFLGRISTMIRKLRSSKEFRSEIKTHRINSIRRRARFGL